MKDKILKLRSEGKTYNEIVEIVGCSKSTVSYYCGEGQKEKNAVRRRKGRSVKNRNQETKRMFLLEFSWRYKKLCGCKKCKIKNPIVLQYDHKNRETKIDSISNMISNRNSLDKIKKEIRKCDILCANCHSIRTAKQLNYNTF